MPVVIRIDGKPEVWGSPQLGLSASERSEYDELHSRHSTQDRELHDKLGSATAQITNALRRAAKARVSPASMQQLESLCQSIEATRRALRGFLADADVSVEWKWRYWVGRELAEMRGTAGIDITPGLRSSWGSDGFSYRPDLTRERRSHAKMLLEKWGRAVEELRRSVLSCDMEEALGGDARPLRSLNDGGRLLATIYAYEQALQPFSAFPPVIATLPVSSDEGGTFIPLVSMSSASDGSAMHQQPIGSLFERLRIQQHDREVAEAVAARERKEFIAGARRYVQERLPIDANPNDRRAMRATLVDLLRDRCAGREPTLFSSRDSFTTRAFRREQERLIGEAATLSCKILSLRIELAGGPTQVGVLVATDAPSNAATATRRAYAAKSLRELAEYVETLASEVDSLTRRRGGLSDQPLRGGVVVPWESPPSVDSAEVGPGAEVRRSKSGEAARIAPATRKSGGAQARLPKRPKDQTRWRRTWYVVKPEYERAKSYEQIAQWLGRMHEELRVSPDTLADIIRAGAAGLLG